MCMYMMHGFHLRSGQLVNGKLVSVLSFPIFGVYVVVIVFGECVIVFQSKALRQESNVHPLHISYDR